MENTRETIVVCGMRVLRMRYTRGATAIYCGAMRYILASLECKNIDEYEETYNCKARQRAANERTAYSVATALRCGPRKNANSLGCGNAEWCRGKRSLKKRAGAYSLYATAL